MLDSVSTAGSRFHFPSSNGGLVERAARAGAQAEGPARDASGLTPSEKQQVEKLKERDAHVRAHEMAHLAAAGSLARGGPSYVFQTGPDGKPYAIGGSVKIDTSPGRTPEETARKAAHIRSAALAVSDPSPQDSSVAAQASALLAEAQQQRGAKPRSDHPRALPPPPRGSITSSRQLAPAEEGPAQDEPAAAGQSRPSFAASVAAAAARYQRN